MTEISPIAEDPYEMERAAQAQALMIELQELANQDDTASLERRYELHCALIWRVRAVGTLRGQEQAEQAVAIARQLQDQLREATALHEWAQVYLYEHGNVFGDDAHPTQEESTAGQRLHEQALQIREQLLGLDHPDVADSLLRIVNQGRLWAPMQPYTAMAERAVQILERAFGPEHERTCVALEMLAMRLRSQRTYGRSLAIYERLLIIYRRFYDSDEDYHIQNTLAQITWTHEAMGNHATALAMLRDQLARQRSALGDHDPSALSLIVEISDVLRKQGDKAGAEAAIAQELERLDVELGSDHPSTLAFLALVGSSYQVNSEFERGRAIYERLIASYERTGYQGAERGYAMLGFLTLLWRQGDRGRAGEVFAHMLPHFAEPVQLIPTLNAFGFLGDIGEDKATTGNGATLPSFYAQLLSTMEQRYGPDHPHIATLLIAWAQRLVQNGEDVQASAIPMLHRVLAIHPAALDTPDQELLRLIRSIDAVLSGAGEYGLVREIYRRALDACTPVLGAEHPRIIDLQDRLDLLPDTWPIREEQAAQAEGTTIGQDETASDPMDDAAFVIFQSPTHHTAVSALCALLASSLDQKVNVVQTLDAAMTALGEILIIIVTNDWAVTLTSEQIIRLQNRKVIGIGFGAAKLFAQLGLEINTSLCVHYGAMAMPLLVEPNPFAQLPGLGDPAGIAPTTTPDTVDHVGLHLPRTSHLPRVVDVLARVQFDPNYALIARQGHHILIGLAASPDAWTPAYANLFRSLAQALYAYVAQPFARAVWETMQPGVYPLTLAIGRSTTEAAQYEQYLRFAKPTTLSIRLMIAGSDSVMLLFMGEQREHWTREDGSDGETLTITIDITEADLQAVGDRYWKLKVTNFDREHRATCELTIDYEV